MCLHGGNQTRRAELCKLCAGNRVLQQHFAPLSVDFVKALLVINRNLLVSAGGDDFDILIAEHRTDTASACGSFAAENAGIKHLVFSGRADNKLAG